MRPGGPGGDLSTLDVWDEHLAAAGAELVHARMALVAELRPYVAAAYADVAGSDEIVDLVYRSTIPVPGSPPTGPDGAPGEDSPSTVRSGLPLRCRRWSSCRSGCRPNC